MLTRDDIEAARAVSRFSDKPDSPWRKWFGEMARKTAVKRLAKYLPLSPEMAAAIELDIRGDTGQVGAVSPLLDTDRRLAAGVQAKTEEQLAALREQLGGQPVTGGPEGPGVSATTPPPAPVAAAAADEGQQPW